jgi:hypothetical protein
MKVLSNIVEKPSSIQFLIGRTRSKIGCRQNTSDAVRKPGHSRESVVCGSEISFRPSWQTAQLSPNLTLVRDLAMDFFGNYNRYDYAGTMLQIIEVAVRYSSHNPL